MDQIKKLELIFKLALAGVLVSFVMSIATWILDARKEKQFADQVGEIPRPAF